MSLLSKLIIAYSGAKNYKDYHVGISHNKGKIDPDKTDVKIAKEIEEKYFRSNLKSNCGQFWSSIVSHHKQAFYKPLLEKSYDQAANNFANFFLTSAIVGFWEGGEFYPMQKNIKRKTSFVNATTRNYHLWKVLFEDRPELLRLTEVGNPYGMKYNNNYISTAQIKNHYHAHIINNLITEYSTENPVVLEIGGGFGGLGYYLFKQGFKGTYINVDIPQSLSIAHYFLKKSFPNHKFADYTDKFKLDSNKIILLPDNYVSEIPTNCVDIAVNIRSLSEMPVDIIDNYMKEIDRVCKSFFYNDNANVSSHKDETPANMFNISDNFKRLFRAKSLFYGGNQIHNRFVEHLYTKDK